MIEVNIDLGLLAGSQVLLLDAYYSLLSKNGLVKGEYTLDLLCLNSAGYDGLSRTLGSLLTGSAQIPASG